MSRKISIIIPCYNEEKTIRTLLDAILAQTYPLDEMEVVIADGLSEDATRSEISGFQDEYPELDLMVIDNTARVIPAGLNMAGVKTAYRKKTPFNVTRLAGITTTIIGTVGRGADPDLVAIARGDSETWRQLPDAIAVQSGFDINRVRLLIGKKLIIGAIVLGDQSLSRPLKSLVTEKVNISSIREQLLNPNSNIIDTVLDFWTAWRKNNAAQ